MKNLYLLLISIILFSCGNERILQLPEIENAKITEIHDVSQAYLFYDETKADSVELNRKNLIITTNWLVNVDKRLTLAQAIPKIKFLQDKKRSAELHKNENAKNYFTCSDTSIKNLGFLEFTDVVYHEELHSSYYDKKPMKEKFRDNIYMTFDSNGNIEIIDLSDEPSRFEPKLDELKEHLISFNDRGGNYSTYLNLNFSKELSFQYYIKIKSIISKLELQNISIDNNEFIY
nr:hypothetical protein [uncultured Psychroserpens sp.]